MKYIIIALMLISKVSFAQIPSRPQIANDTTFAIVSYNGQDSAGSVFSGSTGVKFKGRTISEFDLLRYLKTVCEKDHMKVKQLILLSYSVFRSSEEYYAFYPKARWKH